jgi:hypothetical protein
MALQNFSATEFTPTEWNAADQKPKFANGLMVFILSGFPEKKFPQALYDRLNHRFGFIAHYNKWGFWEEYFTKSSDKLRFLRMIVESPAYGQPEYTYCDVERAVAPRVKTLSLLYNCESHVLREVTCEICAVGLSHKMIDRTI